MVAAVLLASCRGADPRREDAQWLLEVAAQKQVAATCALEDFLRAKPEFASIRDAQFCDAHVSVTRIREVSANERIVEYELARTWRRSAVQQWIEATEKLEARLQTLSPQRELDQPAVGPLRTSFTWTDPSDGQVFTTSVAGNVADSAAPPISVSDEWRSIEANRRFTVSVARDGRDTVEPLEATLRRVGSGWEVTVAARKRSDSSG